MKKISVVTGMILVMLVIMVFPCSGADVIYYGCYQKNNGQLRIVGSSNECRPPEVSIYWNQVGPQGPTGPAGLTGPAGPAGSSPVLTWSGDQIAVNGAVTGPHLTGPAGANVVAGQQCTQGSVIGFDNSGNIICESVPQTYAIGDTGPAGGIVFYITDGGLHGLEAAPADQSSGAAWGCYGTNIAGADGTAVGTGAQNTADIVAVCFDSGIAAKIAHNYTLNGYNNWFLPSKGELNLLYLQKVVVGGIAGDGYWSSSERSIYFAWYLSLDDGGQYGYLKDDLLRVRAVRAF